jgi:PAS domain S-box-containing protein
MVKKQAKNGKNKGLRKQVSILSRKLAEAKKERDFMKSRLDSFADYNPRPIVEIDFKGKVFYMNPRAYHEFPDLRTKGLNHPYLSGFKPIITNIKKYRRGIVRELKIKNIWWRQNIYHIPTFNLIRIFGLDITDRKKLEANLKQNEARYHMLFEKMNYGYALQDIIFDEKNRPVDYKFVDVNPAFEKLSKVKKEDIVGKTANQIARQPQTQEAIELRKKYDRVATTGKPLYFENYNPKTKKYFELYAYKPTEHQIALIFSDITDRKKTDEEKNNFISIMSHELRNPLTPIIANAQFLQRQKLPKPIIREAIDVIEKQAKIMADLLNDILDVSRLSRHKIVLRKSKVNIYDVIRNSVDSSMPFINTKKQKLSLSLGNKPLYIYADPLRLEQIMVNIINNASKYTPLKGRIKVCCMPINGFIEISVIDNGSGMSKEKISRIFDLFKGENQPFMGIGGLGIGLNIVKNLVTMHKGTIHVASEGENKGSKFTIKFPLQKSLNRKETSKPEIIQEKTDGKKENSRILVVDDNVDIRNSITALLTHEGHTVKSTHDGLEAVKISKTFKPDAALIDIGLPTINGYKVAKMLREQHANEEPKMKLIAFTGYGQDKDKELSKDAGFDVHLTKPLDIDHLLRILS